MRQSIRTTSINQRTTAPSVSVRLGPPAPSHAEVGAFAHMPHHAPVSRRDANLCINPQATCTARASTPPRGSRRLRSLPCLHLPINDSIG